MFWHEVRCLLRSRLFAICAVAVGAFSALGGLVFTGVGLAMIDAGEVLGLDQLVRAAVIKGTAAPVVSGVLGAVAVGRLFRNGGLATSLWLVPRRGRLFAAMVGAVAVIGGLLGLVGCAAVASVSLWVGNDLDSPPSGSVLALVALAQVVICATSAAVGASVAIVLRSQAAAMATMLIGPLVLEPMVRASTTNLGGGGPVGLVADYLPVALMERVQIDSGNPVVPVSASAPPLVIAVGVLTLVLAGVLQVAHRRLATLDA
ncbi:hypothetical protein [Nocardioides sp.]|uniref:hypothetical protein n=1 Tax=Nocardioides sp. TaxID=35761 RepID=UPI003D0B5CA9